MFTDFFLFVNTRNRCIHGQTSITGLKRLYFVVFGDTFRFFRVREHRGKQIFAVFTNKEGIFHFVHRTPVPTSFRALSVLASRRLPFDALRPAPARAPSSYPSASEKPSFYFVRHSRIQKPRKRKPTAIPTAAHFFAIGILKVQSNKPKAFFGVYEGNERSAGCTARC